MAKQLNIPQLSRRGYLLSAIVFVFWAICLAIAYCLSFKDLANGINTAMMGLVMVFGLIPFYGGGLLFLIGVVINIYALCRSKYVGKPERMIMLAQLIALIVAVAMAAGSTAFAFMNSQMDIAISGLIWVAGIDLGAVIILVLPWSVRKTMTNKN